MKIVLLLGVLVTVLQNGVCLEAQDVLSQTLKRAERGQNDHVISLSLKNSTHQTTRPDHWDGLGFGVQPYDSLFDHRKLRARVLDLGSLPATANVREKASVRFIDNYRVESRREETFNEFINRVRTEQTTTVPMGSFSATIARRFGFENAQRTNSFFAKTASLVERAHIRIVEPTISNLRSMVIPSVARYLESAPPEEIFEVYGTHVTTGLLVGGDLALWTYASTAEFSSKEEFSEAATVSFMGAVAGSSSLTTEEQQLARRTRSVEGLLVRGGNFRRGPDAIDNWIRSTRRNAQEIRYLPNGVVPIWRLIPDEAQADRVRAWYEQVFGTRAIILKRFSSPPLSELSRSSNPTAQVSVPEGWKVVSGGASVEFFGYGQLLRKSYPVTENGKLIGWRAESSDSEVSDPGKIQAHAVAIWDPFDACDITFRTSTSHLASSPRARAILPSGYALVGGGAMAKHSSPKNFLIESFPVSQRWVAAATNHRQDFDSQVEAFAIGLRFREGGAPRTRIERRRFGPINHPNGVVHASDGYTIIGAGARVVPNGPNLPGSMLVDLEPSADGNSFFGYAKDHIEADRRLLTISSIEIPDAIFVDSVDDVLLVDPTRS